MVKVSLKEWSNGLKRLNLQIKTAESKQEYKELIQLRKNWRKLKPLK